MNKKISEIISNVFERVQDLISTDIQNEITSLKRLISYDPKYFQNEEDQLVKFCKNFIDCLRVVLTSSSRNAYSIDFVAEFLSQLNDNENESVVQNEIISFLTMNNRANSDQVRRRIYQLIGKFLEYTRKNSVDHSLDNRLFTKMQLCVAEGMRDRDYQAQIEAIKAAYSLQHPRDKQCVIVEAYVSLLEHDSLKQVRLLVLDSIVICRRTLDFFKSRLIYDSDEDVRNRIVKAVVKKIPNQFVDARFRRDLIECVLFRTASRELAEMLFFNWLDVGTNPILKFISSLDIEKEWFSDLDPKTVSFNDSKLLQVMDTVYTMIITESNDINKITAPLETHIKTVDTLLNDVTSAFYYRSLVEFVNKRLKLGDLLDQQWPVEILKQIGRQSTRKSISPLTLFNLVQVLLFYLDDTSVLLCLFDADYDERFECVYECVLGSLTAQRRFEFFWEYYRSEKRHELTHVLSLCSLVMSQLSEEDFECLDEWVADLDDGFFDDESETVVQHLIGRLLLDNVPNLEPRVRALVARNLGLIVCVNDLWVVFCHLFSEMIVNDYQSVVIEAQKALFNIVFFHSHGINRFDNETKEKRAKMLVTLEDQFDCLDENISYVACEGFAKLLINHCPLENSERIIAQMLIAYLSSSGETSQTSKRLIGCLNSFFQIYKRLSRQCLRNLIGAFQPTLKFLLGKNSSLTSLKRLAKLFYYLTDETKNLRQCLVLTILDEMFANIDDFYYVQKLIDVLLEFRIHQCDVDGSNVESLDRIQALIQLVIDKFKSEKWRLSKEEYLKEMIVQLKSLIFDNQDTTKEAVKRTNNQSFDEVKDPKILKLV